MTSYGSTGLGGPELTRKETLFLVLLIATIAGAVTFLAFH
jgi:hypothetical protein